MDKLNVQLGRKVFVDIDKLTDKVCTWQDIKRWVPAKKKDAKIMPYPEELKGSGISEVVTVRLIISPKGRVLNPAIQNIKNKELIMPVIEHAAGLRFEIPKVDGVPVYLEQKMKFICSEDPKFGQK